MLPQVVPGGFGRKPPARRMLGGMDEAERLTRGELTLCVVMIAAGVLITAMAVHLLIADRQVRGAITEAETMTQKAASERLGG